MRYKYMPVIKYFNLQIIFLPRFKRPLKEIHWKFKIVDCQTKLHNNNIVSFWKKIGFLCNINY